MKRENLKESTRREGAKRAGLYARVSTDKQLDNSSPDSQLQRTREYCRKRGYKIIAEEIEAMSGRFVLARSKFNRYLNMGADEQLDVVVVDIPDRLGRGDTIAKLELLAQMNNLTVEYASPGRDTSTIEGFIQKSAEQMVSGIERLNIIRRTTQGRRDLARAGRVIAAGSVTYGYRFDRQFDERGHKIHVGMVISEPQAEIVRKIFNWCAMEHLSSHAITQRLNQEGVPTPHGKSPYWQYPSVTHILRNETYIGIWHWAKNDTQHIDSLQGVREHTIRRDRSEWIPVQVPAIISKELFQAAQAEMTRHKATGFKPTKHEYLLRGRLRCASCNGHMQGAARPVMHLKVDRDFTLFYYCRRNKILSDTNRCHARQLRADKAEPLVWEGIRKRLRDRRLLFRKLETNRAETERAQRTIQATIAGLLAENQKAYQKKDRWLELYGDGGMSKEEYYTKKSALEAEIAQRNHEAEEYQAKLNEYQVIGPEQQQELEEYADTVALGMDSASFEEKRKYLEWLRVECVFDDRTGEIAVAGILGNFRVPDRASRRCRDRGQAKRGMARQAVHQLARPGGAD